MEKTRIVHQLDGERNFHVFYQLLFGASEEVKCALLLNSLQTTQFNYFPVVMNSTFMLKSITDVYKKDFIVICRSMWNIGIDEKMQMQIFHILSGILHLGNVSFDVNPESGMVSNISAASTAALENFCFMFGVNCGDVVEIMTKQVMVVGGSSITKEQTLIQATEKRDSFAKSIYSMLFDWLIKKINDTITPPGLEEGKIAHMCVCYVENI